MFSLSVEQILLDIVSYVLVEFVLFDCLLHPQSFLLLFDSHHNKFLDLLLFFLLDTLLNLCFIKVRFLRAISKFTSNFGVDLLIFLFFSHSIVVVLNVESLHILYLPFPNLLLQFLFFFESVLIGKDQRVPDCQLFLH